MDEEKARRRLEALINRAKETDSFDSPQVQRTLKLLLAHLPLAEILAYREVLIKHIRGSEERKVPGLSPLATSSPELSGVHLGDSLSGPVVLTPDKLKRNLGIFGETGAGKTVLMERIVRQCLDRNLVVWIFDFEQEFVHLAKEYDLLYLNWQKMKFNPLAPPIEAKSWLGTFIDVFGFSQGLWLASQGFLGTALYKLYEIFGCFSQNCEFYPTLHQLHRAVEAVKPKGQPQAQYKSRVESRLSLFITLYGDLFDCSSGAQPESLLDRSVIFDFSGMLPFTYGFLADLYLSGLFHLLRDRAGSELTHVVAASEARHLISARQKERLTDIDPFMDQLMARSRRRGLGVILDDQEPSAITKTARANSYTKVLFHLGNGKDIHLMARSLGLTGPQRKLAHRLRIGEALVSVGNKKPQLVQVPFPGPIPKVSQSERELLAKESVEKVPTEEPYQSGAYDRFLEASGFKKKLPEGIPATGLSPQLVRFLKNIAEDPFSFLSKRYKNLGFSGRRGKELSEKLKSKGLVKEVEINIGRGGRPKLLDLTKKGRKVLADLGIKPKSKGKGGIEHRFWQNQVKNYFQGKGYRAEIEYLEDGAQMDVFVHNGKRIGVEVAMSPESEVDNLKKYSGRNFDKIILACKNKEIKSKIERKAAKLEPDLTSTLRFRLVSNFYSP